MRNANVSSPLLLLGRTPLCHEERPILIVFLSSVKTAPLDSLDMKLGDT
jgi:hypothetical protein